MDKNHGNLTFRQYLESRQNRVLHAGYDFRGKVLSRSLSNLIYEDPKRAGFLDSLEPIITFMIDYVKHLRKGMNYRIPIYFRDFN